MRFLKKILVVALCFIAFFIGLMMTISNTSSVGIDLVFVQLPDAPLGVWLATVFLAGTVIGVLISSLIVFALRTRVGSLKRKLASSQKELDQLRVANLKDAV